MKSIYFAGTELKGKGILAFKVNMSMVP